jgi:glycosyltransferase involved in cell wall biosynthesis
VYDLLKIFSDVLLICQARNVSVTMKYYVIIPSLINSGPTNQAIEIARMAVRRGYEVKVFYLDSKGESRKSLLDLNCGKIKYHEMFFKNCIVHTHGLRPDIIGWILKIFNRKIILVNTVHIQFIQDMRFLHKMWIVKASFVIWLIILRSFDAVFCISETMAKYYRRHCNKLKIQVVYNFRSVSENGICSDEDLNWMKGQKQLKRLLLVYIGSLIERKNVSRVVDEVGRQSDLSLIICGDGPLRDVVIDNAKERPNIRWVGFIDDPSAYIKNADCLILPSYAEGFPLVVIEASAVGKISLLSEIGVHKEIERMGIALTFDHRTFVDFEDKLNRVRRMLDDRDISARIRQRYKMELSPEVVAERYFCEFDRIASSYR